LIRRLGRPNQVGAQNLLVGAVSQFNGSDVVIELDGKAPTLRALYIRLPAFRSYPQSAALSVYRREIRRPSGTRTEGSWGSMAFCNGLWGGTVDGTTKGLRCAGDYDSMPSKFTIRPSAPSNIGALHFVDVTWTGVQFPQVPSYIFLCYSKSPSFTTYDNPLNRINQVARPNAADYAVKFGLTAARASFDSADHTNERVSKHVLAHGGVAHIVAVQNEARTFDQEVAARNIAMAQDSNAAILQLEIVVQSAIGSFSFRDSSAGGPYLEDRDILWRRHLRNCHSQYSKGGRGAWQDRECCALLASSDFCLGLSTSPGTQYPITLDIKVRFANKASYRGGACFSTGSSQGQCMFEDIIVGEPTLVGIFTQNVLSIAASSAVLSSQSFSQATTAAALASS